MALRLNLLLLVLVVVCAEFLRTSCFIWTTRPSNPLVVINGKNSTNVVIRWDFDLQSSTFSSMKVERFKMGNKDITEKELANYFAIIGSSVSLDPSKFLFHASGNKLGYGKLTIIDIKNQGTNNDGTTVNVLSSDVYVYQIEVNLPGVPTLKDQIILEVYGFCRISKKSGISVRKGRRHGVRKLPPLQLGDHVKVKLDGEKGWKTEAQVVTRDPKSRSYVIQTPYTRLRRNRRHLRPTPEKRGTESDDTIPCEFPDGNEPESPTPEDHVLSYPEIQDPPEQGLTENEELRTSSGRLVRKPKRYIEEY